MCCVCLLPLAERLLFVSILDRAKVAPHALVVLCAVVCFACSLEVPFAPSLFSLFDDLVARLL